MKQTWNAQQYQENASFVAELGKPVLSLLEPKPNETILDLGCGDGILTEKISKLCSQVKAIDSSESMIESALSRGLDAVLMSGTDIIYRNRFDAVFTNATLHWISDQDALLNGVYKCLVDQGRFVGEFGGRGNIQTLISAVEDVVKRNPDMGTFSNPWYFPSVDEYKNKLQENGFQINSIKLIPRPTPLQTGVKEWLKIFTNYIIADMPKKLEQSFLCEVENAVREKLYSDERGWVADYVRLRFHASKI
ncbi:class I SAM-dependent methyltransferase [Leptolyngbya cf. ectocarpi LEGE 11479]|uniref:Class I SAM-dependent methyltransferase n=1 Tax=Leptolyngbya cf. ectocarpi LEGE 11479 TaxID=1828722 RepID=A0A929FCS1_LEPEC|nr:class I SAM-dependent methyltransferase [Leptolyngbya ectocarpi]MBE9070299.1 class I SAM-dependent methyltransferase [Leptolyngbya cf. ectocarpi LEGE 11479]